MTTTADRTRPGRLSDLARHVCLPHGIVTTGWPAVEARCAEWGDAFDPWQKDAGRAILAKRANGLYAATVGGVVLSIPRQVAKALPLTTPMLTPSGWTTMGDLAEGDHVYAPNGQAVRVLHKSPVMTGHTVYRVTLTDGRTLDADAGHVWTVRDKRRGKAGEWVDMTTLEMLRAGLYRTKGETRTVTLDGKTYETREYRFNLPDQAAIDSPDVELPIDPYIFGAWLGNGTAVTGDLSCARTDAAHWESAVRAAGYRPIVRQERTATRVVASGEGGAGFRARTLQGQLRAIGALGTKIIPGEYLRASARQREAFLQGLMDTDGTISPKGTASFTAKRREHADAVLYLARSLGWRASVATRRAILNGQDHGPAYVVVFTPHNGDGFTPFRMARKAVLVKSATRAGTRTTSIAAIEEVESVPVQCIMVDSHDHLYLAGTDLVPTHNTFLTSRIVFALCTLQPGLTVVWTAHRARTATNTFRNLQALAARKGAGRYVKTIRTTNGEQEIHFANGSRILFGAREAGFGRGFDALDVLVFDEAQILTEKALEDMVPAANQYRAAAGALVFMMGTPPRPIDPGDAFTEKRQAALAGDPDTLYLEFSADHDADPDDREQWRKANPSFPGRTPLESMLRMRKNLPSSEAWLREALGVWHVASEASAIPADAWALVADPTSAPVADFALGLDVSPDRSTAALAFAGRREDGRWHVELDEHRGGLAWVVPHVTTLHERLDLRAVVIDRASPADALTDALQRAGIPVLVTHVPDMAKACGTLFDLVMSDGMRHTDQPQVNVALTVAKRRPLLDSAWGWSRKTSHSDITPIVAETLALYGAMSAKVPEASRKRTGRSYFRM